MGAFEGMPPWLHKLRSPGAEAEWSQTLRCEFRSEPRPIRASERGVALTHSRSLRDDDAIDRLVANIRAKLRENHLHWTFLLRSKGRCPRERLRASRRGVSGRNANRASVAEWCWFSVSRTQRWRRPVSRPFEPRAFTPNFSRTGQARRSSRNTPSLAILEHDPPRIDGMEGCAGDPPAKRPIANHQLPGIVTRREEVLVEHRRELGLLDR